MSSTFALFTHSRLLVDHTLLAPFIRSRLFANHTPLVPCRYHAQIQFLDDQIGNLTAAFKSRGLWSNTLMILHADNGGYTKTLGPCSSEDPVMGITCTSGEAGANNHPLRGGKYSFFEGGIRANSFASGGLLPVSVRGTQLHGLIHVADW